MNWLKDLYVGEKAQPVAAEFLRAAERGKKSKYDKYWLITLSLYPKAQLDLLSVKASRNKQYQGNQLSVLGLASDQAEAYALVEKMTNDCLKASGSPELKSYFASCPFVSWREVRV